MDCWPGSLPRSKKYMFSSLSIKFFLAVGDDRHRRGKDVEQLAMRNIDDPDEAGYHMEVPEKVCIDSYIS